MDYNDSSRSARSLRPDGKNPGGRILRILDPGDGDTLPLLGEEIMDNKEILHLAKESNDEARRSIESLRWYVGIIVVIILLFVLF
jgi:hypothetical protein